MKHLSLLLSSLLLVACGGGGGGGAPAGPVASTSAFALKQALANDFLDTSSYPFTPGGSLTITTASPHSSTTGTVSGSGTVAQSAITNTTFEGVPAQTKTRTITGTLTVTVGAASASQPFPPSLSNIFASQTFDLLGSFTPATVVSGVAIPASYLAAAAPVTLPAAANVGDAGLIGTFNTYGSAAKGAILSTTNLTYSLEADTATTAILKLTAVNTASGVGSSTTVDTYRVTPAGAVTRLKRETPFSVSSGGTTISGALTITY